jgi:hypothetical protein
MISIRSRKINRSPRFFRIWAIKVPERRYLYMYQAVKLAGCFDLTRNEWLSSFLRARIRLAKTEFCKEKSSSGAARPQYQALICVLRRDFLTASGQKVEVVLRRENILDSRRHLSFLPDVIIIGGLFCNNDLASFLVRFDYG